MAIRGEEWKTGDDRDVIIDAKACSDYMKKAFQALSYQPKSAMPFRKYREML